MPIESEAVIGRGGYPATADGLLAALADGYRSFSVAAHDVDWNRPIDLDPFWAGGNSFGFRGPGLLKGAAMHRTYKDPLPMLYSRSKLWSVASFEGVNFMAEDDAKNFVPGQAPPAISISYLDRWRWQNSGIYGVGGRGLELGVGGTLTASQLGAAGDRIVPGVVSEFVMGDRSEFHRCGAEGVYAFGVRNFTIDGRASFERNSQAPMLAGVADLTLVADPGARCGQGSIMGVAFEHDSERHIGCRLRGLRGMHVGINRHMLSGLDAECDDSTWYPSQVWGSTTMRREGKGNRWIGRRQRIVGGLIGGYRIEDDPNDPFDLRYPLDGSGT